MDQSWRSAAACLNTDTDVFYLERGEHRTGIDDDDDAPAIGMCEACPVRWNCLDASMRERFGVWGGWKAETRTIVRRQGHGCPTCDRPMPRLSKRMFCSDDCLDDAWLQPLLVDARLIVMAEAAVEWDRNRKRVWKEQKAKRGRRVIARAINEWEQLELVV